MCKEVVDCKMKITRRVRGSHRRQRHHADGRDLADAPASPSRCTRSSARSRFVSSPRSGTSRLIAKRSAEAIDVAVKAGLPVAYVTEDTTRSRPEVLTDALQRRRSITARRASASRDTVGHATPDGVRNLIHFTQSVIAGTGAKNIGIDWHGHNDRGLALENALWALEFGADRVHGTALGIGERVGNAQMELILLNLKLLGQLEDQRPDAAPRVLRRRWREAVGWHVPINYPLVGRDAFRTATGVHAAAIIKAMAKGRRVARRPHLQRRPRGHVRAQAGDLHRLHERRVERELLAARARASSRTRRSSHEILEGREGARPHHDRRGSDGGRQTRARLR